MKKTITQPRTITVREYTATINVRFHYWDNVGWKWSYYASVGETSKAIKAIAKAAGFNVLKCKSESFAGGDSVDIYVETELTPEQTAKNKEIRESGDWIAQQRDIIKEPRKALLHSLVRQFEDGHFNSMEDIYEYDSDRMTVAGPDGEPVNLTVKYGMEHFETLEEFAKGYH